MIRNIIFIMLFVHLPLLLMGQQEQFIRINETEGLPHNRVNSIFNDSKGFMWFGMGEALCKYDGYKYQKFRSSIEDTVSLSNNGVYDITEDKNGYLWISTYSGLNKFDRKSSTFTSFYVDTLIRTSASNNFFLKTQIDDAGNVWSLVAEKGLYKFNPVDQLFKSFEFPENIPGDSKNQNIQAFYINKEGNIWLSSGLLNKTHGVYNYNPNTNQVRSYIPDPEDPESLSKTGLTTIFEDSKGKVWIGLYEGWEKLDPITGKITKYNYSYDNNIKLPLGKVDVFEEDDEGNIWIGTKFNGLIRMNPESGEIIQYQNDPKNKKSISSNTINSIFNDKKGILWIGTDKGLNKLVLKQKAFHNYLYVSEEDEISTANHILDLYVDKTNTIWYCTEKGLYKYNRRNAPEHVLPVRCKEMVQDKRGRFWLIGDSLIGYDPVQDKALTINLRGGDSKILNSYPIWSLYIDSYDKLWMGTGGGGLNSLDLHNGGVSNYRHEPANENSISTNEVGPIFRDKDEVWIGPYKGGLNKINIKTGKITRYAPHPKDPESLSNDVVSAIHKDKKGRMWIGTYEGVNILDQKQKKFKRIKQKDGLASDNISVNGITEDNRGNIWIATAAGISKINSNTFEIRNYDTRDGFQKNPKATLFKDKKGIIYFFGQNGITAFHPNDIEDNAVPPQIAITDFLIFNKSIVPGESAPIKVEVSDATQINLSYKESFITFEFAALNYLLSEKNQYAYKMEGYDEDWIYAGTKRYATYTNLPPGKTYSFRVKGSNNDGIWNEKGTSLKIFINPPFWQTWWFKAILLTVIIVSLYALYRIRTRQLYSQRRKLAMLVKERTEEVEAQKENLSDYAAHLETANLRIRAKNKKIIRQARKLKAIDRLKTQFLTNISHDFRTPLTLILNPLEEMISKGTASKEIDAQLALMNRNAKRLLQLINQLLDLSKIESGNMPLQLSKSDIVQHLRSICFTFTYLAEKHNIALLFSTLEKEVIAVFDVDKFDKIIYNLLSNAFKFTPDEGKISVSLAVIDYKGEGQINSSTKNLIEIKVKDSGIGIPAEHIPFIFDRFYQVEPSSERKSEGTGIGLSLCKELVELHGGTISVESSENCGTTFTIQIPNIDVDSKLITVIEPEESKFSLSEQNNDAALTSEDYKTSEQEGLPVLLIVEDNNDLRQMIIRQFKPHFNVEEAENGILGWEKAIEILPDLIISDVMMPGKDGLILCQQLKSDVRTSHIPTILLSAKMDGEEAGLGTGADDYITKPFNSTILMLKVKNLLENRKHLRAHIRRGLGVKPIKKKSAKELREINLRDQKFLEQTSLIVERNLTDADFDLELLYHELGMSRTLVYRKLKSLTGLSPNEFVRHFRLNKAAQFLLEGDITITEVMYKVGFNHRSYFINSFKKQFEVAPSEYALKQKLIDQSN